MYLVLSLYKYILYNTFNVQDAPTSAHLFNATINTKKKVFKCDCQLQNKKKYTCIMEYGN